MNYAEAKALCNENERRMLDALMALRPDCLDWTSDGCYLHDHPHLRIIPQHHSPKVAPFTLDFAVILTLPGCEPIMVDAECDGYDFHQATKTQVERDLIRNRRLKALGWHVERFAGSEVWANAPACALTVQDLLDREFTWGVEAHARARHAEHLTARSS